jgi:hypothetical protein
MCIPKNVGGMGPEEAFDEVALMVEREEEMKSSTNRKPSRMAKDFVMAGCLSVCYRGSRILISGDDPPRKKQKRGNRKGRHAILFCSLYAKRLKTVAQVTIRFRLRIHACR